MRDAAEAAVILGTDVKPRLSELIFSRTCLYVLVSMVRWGLHIENACSLNMPATLPLSQCQYIVATRPLMHLSGCAE